MCILFSALSGMAMAFWFGESYVPFLPPRGTTSTSPQTPSLDTSTTFVLTADSFVGDDGKPVTVKGASFSHGMGVVQKQIETFQNIVQAHPELGSTILYIATFDGQTIGAYGANGPITDPSQIPPNSKRIISFIADIQGDTIDEKTGKTSFSADSVYKTLSYALEALKKSNAPIIVNLSLSADSQVQALEDLMNSYPNALFVASAGGWPGNYAATLNNVIAVGSTSDSREGTGKNIVYAPGRVEVVNPSTGVPESAYGRSFSVPQAVMTAALAWQQNGNFSSADVKNIIIGPTLVATADSEPGILNPQASLELTKSYTPSTPNVGIVNLPPSGFEFGFIW
jgi:hypothetical protein